MLPDDFGQLVLFYFGMDDTHPITTSSSCVVVTMTLSVGCRECEILKLSPRVIESSSAQVT